jgi:site-specific DNA-methyltransferase (adenine-specific)
MKIDILNTKNKYKIIYADPPWCYRDKRVVRGGSSSHYRTMSLKEIKNLQIQNLSDNQCTLFLWTTFPFLKEALEIIDYWGFEYKTCGFNWIKIYKKSKTPCFGIGYYTKSNSEICLLAVKKKSRILKPISNKISQIIISPRREHSRKPDETKERIVKLLGDLPRIELFARNETEGWDYFGDEI